MTDDRERENELIVVASRGEERAGEIAALKGFGSARLVEVDQVLNRGSAAAQGILEARAPFVALHENHSFPAADTFQKLIDVEHPHQLVHMEDAARALQACGMRFEAADRMVLLSGARSTFRKWIGGIATAGGVEVRYTPWLTHPARMALRSLPRAAFVGRWQTLDYQVRPRAYALENSIRLLGPYQGTALQQGASEIVRWHQERDRA